MQKTHNILYRTMQPAALLASLMFVLLLAACDNGDVPGGGQSDGGYSAGFYITTGNQTVSRAPSPGEYEPGSAIENLIDIERGDFKVLLFDRNDLYLGSLNHTMIKLVSTALTRHTVSTALSPRRLSTEPTSSNLWCWPTGEATIPS